MEEISNIDIYLKRMAATLADKCWWVTHLPPEITTVVDYGCAQGDLALFLEQRDPGRFRYIGIDNAPAMLALAEKNLARMNGSAQAAFYQSIAAIGERCDVSHAVLVLNSVMHEVFSYLTAAEQAALLTELFGAGFRYVAVRDMNMPSTDVVPFDLPEAIAAIENSPCANLWREYNAYLDGAEHHRAACWSSTALRIFEFLLKYKYTDNWDREMRETYYWDWLRLTEAHWRDAGYRLAFDLRFHIPFLRNQIHADFGLDFPVDTHRKVLLARDG